MPTNFLSNNARYTAENRVIEAVHSGETVANAAKANGISRRRSYKLLQSDELKRRLQAKLNKRTKAKGGALGAMADVLLEGMSANLPEMTKRGLRESDVADHKTRISSVKTLADVIGLTEKSTSSGAANIVINIPLGMASGFRAPVEDQQPRNREGRLIEGEVEQWDGERSTWNSSSKG